MQPVVSRRLRIAAQAELLEHVAAEQGHRAHLVEADARRRVEVDAQLVGVRRVGGEIGPQVQPEAADVHGPDDVGDVGDDEGIGRGAVRRRDGGRLQPVGCAGGDALLVEGLAGGAVGEALQHGGPSAGGVQQVVADVEVVGDQVELGGIEGGKVDLVRPRHAHLASAGLHHPLSSSPGTAVDSTEGPSGAGSGLGRTGAVQAWSTTLPVWVKGYGSCELWRGKHECRGARAPAPGEPAPARGLSNQAGVARTSRETHSRIKRAVVGELPGQRLRNRGRRDPSRAAWPGSPRARSATGRRTCTVLHPCQGPVSGGLCT